MKFNKYKVKKMIGNTRMPWASRNADRDGVINIIDCQPYNKYRQDKQRKLSLYKKKNGITQYNARGWAFSMLSDVQEMIDREHSKSEINEKINNVKRVLQGKYKEDDEGIVIISKKQNARS